MADEGPDDVDLIKTTRIVCQHGAVNEVTVRTEQVGHDCKVTVTQRICEKCMELQTEPRALP